MTRASSSPSAPPDAFTAPRYEYSAGPTSRVTVELTLYPSGTRLTYDRPAYESTQVLYAPRSYDPAASYTAASTSRATLQQASYPSGGWPPYDPHSYESTEPAYTARSYDPAISYPSASTS